MLSPFVKRRRSKCVSLKRCSLAEQSGFPAWVSVDAKKLEGTFKTSPDRNEIANDVNESLIVELYSR